MKARACRPGKPDQECPRSSLQQGLPLFVGTLFLLACAGTQTGIPTAGDLQSSGPHELKSRTNLLTNHTARNSNGSINVVIEIPAGTSEKWEVSSDGFALVREFEGGKPRVVDYLPYPGSYGLIPRTLLDTEKGGDGGALDVMVLGPAVPRGQVVRARPVGIIRFVDQLEQDDKVLAVIDGETLQQVYDIESLKTSYPGVIEILDIWWSNAHGKGNDVSLLGTGSRAQANSVIDYAIDSWLEVRSEKRRAETEK